jgi:hypothetical protein
MTDSELDLFRTQSSIFVKEEEETSILFLVYAGPKGMSVLPHELVTCNKEGIAVLEREEVFLTKFYGAALKI